MHRVAIRLQAERKKQLEPWVCGHHGMLRRGEIFLSFDFRI